MALYLYTEEYFLKYKIKRFVKKMLGKNFGGPLSVQKSLTKGLTELGVPFFLNKNPGLGAIAGVLSGPQTLQWAIKQKKKGKISKLIAGPNIVITPRDYNKLIMNAAIDRYVVPAKWSVDWWTSLEPVMKKVLCLWPAGVADRGALRKKGGYALVYQKTVPTGLADFVKLALKKNGIRYKVLEYGKFQPEEYGELLKGADFLVYLTEHESQGLALHEAWMGNVPTLVWDGGGFSYPDRAWKSPGISAPYLTSACGMFFLGRADFEKTLKEFIGAKESFTPRAYSLANFTDKRSAQRYLEIIEGKN